MTQPHRKGGRRYPVGFVVALAACSVVLSASPAAHAWSNGVGGCNSYGTHDWILDQALQATGERTAGFAPGLR